MNEENVFAMPFSRLYPLYVAKAEKKGRSEAEVKEIICWLCGYSEAQLKEHLQQQTTLRDFFAQAEIHPDSGKVTGIGVLLCLWGMAQLEFPWRKFRMRVFFGFYAFYTLADLLIGLLGIALPIQLLNGLPVLSNVLMLYLTFEITSMIQHMENGGKDLYGKELRIIWILLCVSQCVTTFVFLVNDVNTLFGAFGNAQWLVAMLFLFVMIFFLVSTTLWLGYLYLTARQYDTSSLNNS